MPYKELPIQIQVEMSRINHLRKVHSMEVEDINEFNRTAPMSDWMDEPVRCPKCPTTISKLWSHL